MTPAEQTARQILRDIAAGRVPPTTWGPAEYAALDVDGTSILARDGRGRVDRAARRGPLVDEYGRGSDGSYWPEMDGTA